MLTNFIQKLRKKPEGSRAFLVWTTTAIIMLIIIALWLNFSVKQYFSVEETGQLKIDQSSQKSISKFSKFFKEAENDLNYLKGNLTQTLGNFFSGKNEPKEIPPEPKKYLPQKQSNPNPPVKLPKTD